ncbi:MAG: alpha/beta hydrolase [Acidobacteriota bacterium]
MKLHFEERGQGPPVVLLHGFTGCAADWHALLPLLPSGRRYLIPDLRGHGRSFDPEGAARPYTHRQAALDVWKLIDSLGIEGPVSACGVSGGAMALLHMATQLPDRLRSMVLVSATTHYPPEARQIMAASPQAEDQPEEAWAEMRAKHPGGDAQIRALWRQARAFGEDTFDMSFKASDLEAIEADTFLVHGDRDPLFPVEIPTAMYRAIPKSSLWIIPGGGHVPIFGSSLSLFFMLASEHLAGSDS